MNPRLHLSVALLLVAVFLLPGCNRAATAQTATGSVIAQEIVLPAPAVLPRIKSAASPARVRVTTVTVRPGEPVAAGQPLLSVDAKLLSAEALIAHAEAASAEASVAVLDQRFDDTGDARATLSSKRREVVAAIDDATAARATLAARLTSAQAALAAARGVAGSVDASGRPASGPAAARAAAAKAQLEGGVATLTRQLARVDAGLAQARQGLGRLSAAGSTLAEARGRLSDVRELARLVALASATGARLADARAAQATVLAPTAGTVIDIARPGATVAEGAPVATVRAEGPSRVRVWLPTSWAGELTVGDSAYVTLDSLPGQRLPANVSFIGTRASFPPNNLAMRIIHLIRAVRVEVELTGSAKLPPGTPADVVFEQR